MWRNDPSFRTSYNWLVEQMKHGIGNPPQGVVYPIWAWHTLDAQPAKVDL